MCPAIASVFTEDRIPHGTAIAGPFRRALFPAYRLPDTSTRAYVLGEDGQSVLTRDYSTGESPLVVVPMSPTLYSNAKQEVTESALSVLDAASTYGYNSPPVLNTIEHFRHRAINFLGEDISILSGRGSPPHWRNVLRSEYVPANSRGSVVYAIRHPIGVIAHGPEEGEFAQTGFVAFSGRSIFAVVLE